MTVMERLVHGLVWLVTLEWLRRRMASAVEVQPPDSNTVGAGQRPYRYSEQKEEIVISESTRIGRALAWIDSFFGRRTVQQIFRWSLLPVFGTLIFWVIWLVVTGSIPTAPANLSLGEMQVRFAVSRIFDVPAALFYTAALVLFVKYANPIDKSYDSGMKFIIKMIFFGPTVYLGFAAVEAFTNGTGLTADFILRDVLWLGITIGIIMSFMVSLINSQDKKDLGSGWQRIKENTSCVVGLSLVSSGFVGSVATLPVLVLLGATAALISLFTIVTAALVASLPIILIVIMWHLWGMLMKSTNFIRRWLQAEEFKPTITEEKKD
ncbi:MAG: hypothetical protein V1738_03285 [Patescibacteria group bacterium]